jgi:hypothetical protein
MRKYSDRKIIVFAGVALLVAVIAAVVSRMLAPHPSVSAYCKLYENENTQIGRNNSPNDLANDYAQLERVAPEGVKNDTITLKKIYQMINNKPSESLTASFNGLSAEANVKVWVTKNCGK